MVVANGDRDCSNVIQGIVPQKLLQPRTRKHREDEDEKSVLIYTVSPMVTSKSGKPHLMQGCVEGWKLMTARRPIFATAKCLIFILRIR